MSLHPRGLLALTCLTALSSLVACGDDSVDGSGGSGAATPTTTTTTTTTGSGGQGGQGQGGQGGGTAGTGGEGGSVPTTCDASAPMEHPTCTEPCPIDLDVALRCTDRSFAEYGIRVAATEERIGVGVASPDEPRVVTISADGIATDLNPFENVPSPLFVAATRDGVIGVAADETTFGEADDYPGGIILAETADGATFTREEVADVPDRFIPVVDFEYGPDGTPFVFHARFPGTEVAVREGDAWTSTPVYANESGYNRYSVSESGEIVAIDTVESGAGYTVRARVGDAAPTSLGSVDGSGVQRFRPAHPASADLPLDVPSLAVVAQGDAEVVLLWDDATGPSSIAIPGSESFVPSCASGFGDPTECPVDTPCREEGVGVVPSAFAVARTADGAAVVAYVETTFDQTTRYEVQCGEPPGQTECYCVGNLETDDSTATLHVVRVTPGGSAETILTLPVGRFAPGMENNGWAEMHAVDARAFGNDVVIALRVLDEGGAPSVRVLRLRGT